MTIAGIEAMNAFAGAACLDVHKLAEHRGLDMTRFDNLLMHKKTVALPYEDPITFGVNAAKPLIDALSPAERDRIELVITCTESAFDFGKSMSTYMHDLLGLNRNCRLFEVKNACYSGVAGLQMAINFILSQTSPGAKALVIATDISRFMLVPGREASSMEWSFAEPSGGAAGVAALVSEQPRVFQIDVGASGYYGYEVMDTCRPVPDSEAGDADLSLLSYLDCCENAWREYEKRVPTANYASTFDYLAFHTPFGGMVKGAHRSMMRKMVQASAADIESDFIRRVMPGMTHCQQTGNAMGATTLLSLFSTIDHADMATPRRIGCFSYGSGCCSEFFSGVTTPTGQAQVRAMQFKRQLDRRHELSLADYESLLQGNNSLRFGTRDVEPDRSFAAPARQALGQPVLFLKAVKSFHREYEWVGA